MKEKQLEMLNELNTEHKEATKTLLDYWHLYSDFGTWQFWVMGLCLLALPLVVLYFTIDRQKIFLLGFYGFSINVWFNFTDSIGLQLGWWDYPYMLIPFVPTGFFINATVIPVVFILVYQWTLNHNRNFYLFSFLAAIILSFVFEPVLISLNFFRLEKGLNYFHLLLVFIGVFLLSKLIVNAFLYRQKRKNTGEEMRAEK